MGVGVATSEASAAGALAAEAPEEEGISEAPAPGEEAEVAEGTPVSEGAPEANEAEASEPPSPEGAPEAEASSSPGATSSSGARGAHLSALRLTRATVSALAHRHLSGSRIAFTFTLSAPATVHVSISRETRRGGHRAWRALIGPRHAGAVRGSNQMHLTGAVRLTTGSYRLGVTLAHGRSHTLTFRVA
ncbi:MAG: hypothetical protein ACYDA6_01520 [Solirubrobacteraceae bacterium]